MSYVLVLRTCAHKLSINLSHANCVHMIIFKTELQSEQSIMLGALAETRRYQHSAVSYGGRPESLLCTGHIELDAIAGVVWKTLPG